ncbi:MAG: lysophospholipid acyltransferase family protein [Bacteroidales bacterium]|nr:lysophospholipid acyltransferase family protein [Bacteroidales bacterium]
MNGFIYYILLSFVWLVSRLPFFILYRISDLIFLIAFYVFPYRKKIVYKNLRNAFPEKHASEINRIAKEFYRYFCDFLVESVKPYSLSLQELDDRFRFTNPEVMYEFHNKERDYAVISGHYGNWEFNANQSLMAKRDGIVVYRPLKNKNMDRLFKRLRIRPGGVMTPMKNVFRVAMEYRNHKKPFFIWFIADQRPPRNNAFWTTFMNQPTSFFNGVEKISRKLDLAILFMQVTRIKRGYYEVTLKKLFDSAAWLPENAITLAFVKELEDEIKKAPQYWLWSHNRWKHKPDDSTVVVPR